MGEAIRQAISPFTKDTISAFLLTIILIIIFMIIFGYEITICYFMDVETKIRVYFKKFYKYDLLYLN